MFFRDKKFAESPETILLIHLDWSWGNSGPNSLSFQFLPTSQSPFLSSKLNAEHPDVEMQKDEQWRFVLEKVIKGPDK